MQLRLAALDQLAELGECLGVWDGHATPRSDESIRQPLCRIGSSYELPVEISTIATAMESQYAIKAAGETFVSYWNAGIHRKLFAVADSLSVPLRAWCHHQLGKVYHCAAGAIIKPGADQLPYLIEAMRHYEQVPKDAPLPLPIATPVSGVLTETHQAELKPLRGQPTPVFLSESLVRPHRYLAGLYTNIAVRRLLSLEADREEIRQLINKAKGEIRDRWERDGISNHAAANFGYFQAVLLAIENEVEGNNQNSSREYVEGSLFHALEKDGIVPSKRLLWRAGACAVMASVLQGESEVSFYTDAALRNARELIIMTKGRALRSLLNDPQFVLARHRNIDFRDEFEKLCCAYSALDSKDTKQSRVFSDRAVPKSEPEYGRPYARSKQPDVIALVQKLNADGLHQEDVASELGLTQSMVSRILDALRRQKIPVRTYVRRPKVRTRDPHLIAVQFGTPSNDE